MEEQVIARLAPTPARRIIAAGSLLGLGLVILWLAANQPAQSAGLLSGLVVLALASVALSVLIWRATGVGLILTATEMRDTADRRLFLLSEVEQIEKGVLAWKPAGGFAVVLNKPQKRVWVPGIWWRLGRRVMIGGATNSGEAKAMADLMRAELDRQKQ